MSSIRLKNFGPIKQGYLSNNGWLDINKVTVFIGDQGSGKSTLAKSISALFWMEKALNRGDLKGAGHITYANMLDLFHYQRILSYFNDYTEIEYSGLKFTIRKSSSFSWPVIEPSNSYYNYVVPKIMYVPSERNFFSSIESSSKLGYLPGILKDYGFELRRAQEHYKNKEIPLPISNSKYFFDENDNSSKLLGDDFKINLSEAASGFQSLIPLYLVSKFLTEELDKDEKTKREELSIENSLKRNSEISSVMFDDTLTEDEKKKRIEEIDSKYLNNCFINIVEEPEQNLFPSSQGALLKSLIELNNFKKDNKLVLTTHSPYIINELTLLIHLFINEQPYYLLVTIYY